MNNEQEIDIMQAIKTVLKKKNILLVIMIISLVLGTIYTFIINRPKYQSNTKILIDKNAPSLVEYVDSNDIMAEVANSLNVSVGHIQNSVTVTFDAKTVLITITASSTNNQEAYNMVVKYSEILKTKLETTYAVRTYTIIEQPHVANSAYNVTYIKDLLMFLVVGAVICGVYSIFLVVFSGTNIFPALQNAKINLLGKISKEEKSKSKVKAYISKNDKNITQIKKIMTNIELNKRVQRPKSILVTSPNYGTGTTYVVSNLAMRYSKSNRRVLIIDSNFINGIEDKIFNVKSEVGLTDLILKKDIYEDDIAKAIKQTPIKNIFVLPHGDEEIDEELLISNKISRIISLVKNQFDIIIVDGEPILKQITSYGWANTVNATVIVAEYGKTKIEDIIKTKQTIIDVGRNGFWGCCK